MQNPRISDEDPRELVGLANIRKAIREPFIDSLAASIAEVGLLQYPLVSICNGKKQLIAGKQRCLAVIKLKWTTIPCQIVEDEVTASEVVQRQLIENCQRTDLLPSEVATGMRELTDAMKWNLSQTAKRLGVSPSEVTKHVALLSLVPEILAWVDGHRISVANGYEISKLATPEEQLAAATRLIEGKAKKDRKQKPADDSVASAPKLTRIQLALPSNRDIVVHGPEMTMESLKESLQELLGHVKRELKRGIALDTFSKLMRDQAGRKSDEETQ